MVVKKWKISLSDTNASIDETKHAGAGTTGR
jgi:hypothetical protein